MIIQADNRSILRLNVNFVSTLNLNNNISKVDQYSQHQLQLMWLKVDSFTIKTFFHSKCMSI